MSKHYAYLILKPASATPILRGNGGEKGFFALFLLVSGKYRLIFAWYRHSPTGLKYARRPADLGLRSVRVTKRLLRVSRRQLSRSCRTVSESDKDVSCGLSVLETAALQVARYDFFRAGHHYKRTNSNTIAGFRG